MGGLLTPRRRYDAELLDAPGNDPALVWRTVHDIRRSNTVFCGTRAAVAELKVHFDQLPSDAILLDVGTGLGDVPHAAMRTARGSKISLCTIGMDAIPAIARGAGESVSHAVCGSGLMLPFGTNSVDIAMCSQTLHHFRGAEETALLREMNRVARIAVVISDLRRSWIAASGFWLASFPLRFHAVTRHDGYLSVLRGYTRDELSDAVFRAVGTRPVIQRRLAFRMTASWRPTDL